MSLDVTPRVVKAHYSNDGHRLIKENGTDLWDCYSQTSVGPWRGKYITTINGWEEALKWLN